MTVSVLLPVYNCPQYVGAAIESILAQTFEDFEFLIIDDGSTDETPAVLHKYVDPRIRHVRQDNRGLAATLNVGLEMSRGALIARQDQDDLSHPSRLQKQLEFMRKNVGCALLGTGAEILEGDRRCGRFHRHPTSNARLRYELLFNNPFVHSSVMLRKNIVTELGGYSTDRERQPPEDYELWSRIARRAEIANLEELLLFYREVPGSMSRVGPSPFRDNLVRIGAENIAFWANLEPEDPSARNVVALTHGALDLVTDRPDFIRMAKALYAAAEAIEPASARLHEDASCRLTSLKALNFSDRTLLGRLIRNPGPLRVMAKICYQAYGTIRRALC